MHTPQAVAHRIPLNPLSARLRLALAGLAVATCLSHTPAMATDHLSVTAARHYTQPAGPLSQALYGFAARAGITLTFDATLTEGRHAPALDGEYTPEAGLARLLAGSGLEAVRGEAGGYRLRRLPAEDRGVSTLAPVTVTDTQLASSGELPAPYAGGQVARGGRMGLLGSKDNMDTPFSATQYTAELIEQQQAQSIGDVLVNDPSVRNTYSRGTGRDEFNIRGFTLFNYDVSFNGLYGVSPRNASALIGVERVEVLRGPNALLNGMAPYGSVGGAINLVPKRAGAEPLNRVTLSYIDDNQLGAHLDVARRYGEQQQWGVRLNGLRRSGDLPMKDSKEELNAFSLGVDYLGDRFRAEFDISRQDRLTHARSGLLFPPASGTRIVSPPDADGNFFPAWTFWDAEELSASTRVEFDLDEDWVLFGALGHMQYDFSSLQTNWLLLDDQGTIGARPTRLKEEVTTTTAEAGVRGRFQTGVVQHEPVLSVSHFELEHRQQRTNGDIVLSNLFNPSPLLKPTLALVPGVPKIDETRLKSIALADTLSIRDGQIQLTLGLRHQQVVSSDFSATTGARTSHYDKSAVTPAVGFTVKPIEHLSLYGNYIEGLSLGPTAGAGTSNEGETFPPMKTKQFEIGAKRDFGRFSATLSAFQIERPSALTDPATLRFSVNGEQRNRGLELIGQGELRHDLRLLAGAAWTQAKLLKTAGGTNDGNTAPAVPRLQLNLSGEWDTPYLPGLTLTARALRTSSQYVDAANTQKLPGWTRVDLGARYAFTAGNTPLTVRASVENVFNKDYWQSAAREGLTLAAPRTLLLSVSADF